MGVAAWRRVSACPRRTPASLRARTSAVSPSTAARFSRAGCTGSPAASRRPRAPGRPLPRPGAYAPQTDPHPGAADVLHARADLDDTRGHTARIPRTLQGAHREEWRGQDTAPGGQGRLGV